MTYSEELLREVYQQLLESPEDRINFAAKQFNVLPRFVHWYAKADPTKNLEYILWITKQAKRQYVRFPEDTDKVKESLALFDRLKRLGNYKGKRDINKFEKYGDLAAELKEFEDTQSNTTHERIQIENGVEEIYNHSGVKIFEVTTQEAGAKLFRDTKWCVKDPKYFNSYKPPFYMLTLAGRPHFLVHVEKHQIKNVNDSTPTQHELDKVPYVMMALHTIPGMTQAIKDAEKPADFERSVYEVTMGFLDMFLDQPEEFDDENINVRDKLSAFLKEYPNIKSKDAMWLPKWLIDTSSDIMASDHSFVDDTVLSSNDFSIFNPDNDGTDNSWKNFDYDDWHEFITAAVRSRWPKYIKTIYDTISQDHNLVNYLKHLN